jgi:murein DD-endopeptidase MepM/ murein hydrolase activator NlpD
MSDFHVWAALGVSCFVLAICAYLVLQNRAYREEVLFLSDQYEELEAQFAAQNLPRDFEEQLAKREAEIRAEFERREAAMATEMSRLYDLERELRTITGLPTRPDTGGGSVAVETEGQGGPPVPDAVGRVYEEQIGVAPMELIMGLDNPSADMILEEMRLRLGSLGSLLKDAEEQRLRLAHTPAMWPTEDPRRRVTSKFGPRRDPFTKRWRDHSGIDIRSDYGAPVLSTADGVVYFSGYEQYLGHAVKIDHGYGFETVYGHLSKRLVSKGDTVKRGDAIGKVGSSGRSTGPHIHYEVHVGGKRVDPREYIGR